MAGESAALGADVPDVQVVNIVYAFDFAQRGFEDFEVESAGSAFEQNVERLANYS